MKVYSFLNKETYDAVIATAKEQQMDVIGHIPYALSVEYVVDAGQKMIAHTEEVAKHAHGDYSAERISYFAEQDCGRPRVDDADAGDHASHHRRLHQPGRPLCRAGEPSSAQHPMQRDIWAFISNMYQEIPPDARIKLRDDFEKFQRPFTKVFHDKGGQLMTGTDALLPRLVPGFALHQELQELVEVGLTPYEALRTSTTIPYEYLGEAEGSGHDQSRQAHRPPAGRRKIRSKTSRPPRRSPALLMRGRWIGIRRNRIRERPHPNAPPPETNPS